MRALPLSILLLIVVQGSAQEISDQERVLDRLADELLATANADLSYEELYETLSHLLANPTDINAVTQEQLRAVMILSEEEINSFLDYRSSYGPFISTLELQAVPGWSETTIGRFLPFVTLRDPTSQINRSLFQRMSHETNNYLVLKYERTLETKRGFQPSTDSAHRYLGSPDKYYLRYRVTRSNDFSFGVTAEKDPGEPMGWNPDRQQYGFDFVSAHLQLMKKGWLDNLIVGDFQCQFAQGLQLGSVFGLGKNSETITGTRRGNLGFLPYTSAGESIYFRGTALSLKINDQFRVHTFYSFKKRDATVEENETSTSSLLNSGLHRTQTEIQSRNQIGDRDAGVVIQFRRSHLDAGLIGYNKVFDQVLSPSLTPYNQFRFRGTSYTNVGAYCNFSFASLSFFSEFAHTISHGSAMTIGLIGNLTSKLELAWLYRSFARDYYSDYANAFSESTAPQNEEGLYWGAKYTFNKRVWVNAYLDVFRFPWLRYRIYQPSEGMEWLLRLNYMPSKSVSCFIQAREEIKSRNQSEETVSYQISPGSKKNIWISCEYKASSILSFKTRLQGSEYQLNNTITRGMAFVQDITVSGNRWSASFRYALFDTDDYENRLYVYEKDVWLTTSLPAYNGRGTRIYLLLHYAITPHADVWLRWSRTNYLNRSFIGSGGDQIDENTRNDVKFQLRIRF